MQMGFQKRFDDRVAEALLLAGLGKVLDDGGLDLLHEEWNDVLSGGERQRMGFARLYFHSPAFAVLDEATSAIAPGEELKLYEQLIARGTTVLSIAHRLELRALHTMELRIKGDGTGEYDIVTLKQ